MLLHAHTSAHRNTHVHSMFQVYLTVVMTTTHILIVLKGSMVVRVKIQKNPQSPWEGYTLSSTGSLRFGSFTSCSTGQTVTTSPFHVFIPRKHINQSLATGINSVNVGTHALPVASHNAVCLPQRLSVKYFYVTSDINSS